MHSAPSTSLPKCCSSQHVNTLDDVYPRRHAEDFSFLNSWQSYTLKVFHGRRSHFVKKKGKEQLKWI